jgi:hypothetical protein
MTIESPKKSREKLKFLECNENENNLAEALGYSKGTARRKVYSYEDLH